MSNFVENASEKRKRCLLEESTHCPSPMKMFKPDEPTKRQDPRQLPRAYTNFGVPVDDTVLKGIHNWFQYYQPKNRLEIYKEAQSRNPLLQKVQVLPPNGRIGEDNSDCRNCDAVLPDGICNEINKSSTCSSKEVNNNNEQQRLDFKKNLVIMESGNEEKERSENGDKRPTATTSPVKKPLECISLAHSPPEPSVKSEKDIARQDVPSEEDRPLPSQEHNRNGDQLLDTDKIHLPTSVKSNFFMKPTIKRDSIGKNCFALRALEKRADVYVSMSSEQRKTVMENVLKRVPDKNHSRVFTAHFLIEVESFMKGDLQVQKDMVSLLLHHYLQKKLLSEVHSLVPEVMRLGITDGKLFSQLQLPLDPSHHPLYLEVCEYIKSRKVGVTFEMLNRMLKWLEQFCLWHLYWQFVKIAFYREEEKPWEPATNLDVNLALKSLMKLSNNSEHAVCLLTRLPKARWIKIQACHLDALIKRLFELKQFDKLGKLRRLLRELLHETPKTFRHFRYLMKPQDLRKSNGKVEQILFQTEAHKQSSLNSYKSFKRDVDPMPNTTNDNVREELCHRVTTKKVDSVTQRCLEGLAAPMVDLESLSNLMLEDMNYTAAVFERFIAALKVKAPQHLLIHVHQELGMLGRFLFKKCHERQQFEVAFRILSAMHKAKIKYFGLMDTSCQSGNMTKAQLTLAIVDVCLNLDKYKSALIVLKAVNWAVPCCTSLKHINERKLRLKLLKKLVHLLLENKAYEEASFTVKKLIESYDDDVSTLHEDYLDAIDLNELCNEVIVVLLKENKLILGYLLYEKSSTIKVIIKPETLETLVQTSKQQSLSFPA